VGFCSRLVLSTHFYLVIACSKRFPNSIKFFRAISRVNAEIKTDVSVTGSVSIIWVNVKNDQKSLIYVSLSSESTLRSRSAPIRVRHQQDWLENNLLLWSFFTLTLMMETEPVPEKLVFNSVLTRLIARKDLVAFIRCESFKSYIDFHILTNKSYRNS
jgi:hypothetical protein